jgi:hypothetical protein
MSEPLHWQVSALSALDASLNQLRNTLPSQCDMLSTRAMSQAA